MRNTSMLLITLAAVSFAAIGAADAKIAFKFKRLTPGSTVMLNPQPLPPAAKVALNPQPLPPRR